MARRARGTEDKQARRAVILEAARGLFHAGGGGLPTVAQVAEAAGLAKGTVYLYFETKEEIFAHLLLEEWIPVMSAAQTIFEGEEAAPGERVERFVASLVEHLEAHPELLPLDALGAGVLEANMTREALMAYKRRFADHLLQAGGCIDAALQLVKGRGVQILMRSYALTRGLWQATQHDEEAMALEAPLGLMLTPEAFLGELREALTEYWRGALATTEPLAQG